MKKIYLLLFCSIISLPVFCQTAAISEDQKVLLTESLRRAFVSDKSLPDYELLLNKKKIILLDKMVSESDAAAAPVYLTPEVLPRFKKVKFILLSEEAINKLKPKKKDLLFVRLASIDIPVPIMRM